MANVLLSCKGFASLRDSFVPALLVRSCDVMRLFEQESEFSEAESFWVEEGVCSILLSPLSLCV